MMKYISEHQLKVVGNAYEERLIDEIASKDLKNQVFQIKIQVQIRIFRHSFIPFCLISQKSQKEKTFLFRMEGGIMKEKK